MPRPHTLLVFLLFLCAGSAGAGETVTPWKRTAPAQSRLIIESAQFAGPGVHRAGVEFRLDKGWWTYWRAPGSSGMPPSFDWSGSENLAETPETVWPVPMRAVAYGASLNLYRGRVVLPVEFRAADPSKPVRLKVRIVFGACRDVCVPLAAVHEISVAPGKQPVAIDRGNARAIAAFRDRGPSSDPLAAGLGISGVRSLSARSKVTLAIRARGLKDKSSLVLVEGPGFARAAELPSHRSADGERLLLLRLGRTPEMHGLSGKRVRITLIDAGRALEQVWVVDAEGNTLAGPQTRDPRWPAGKPEPWVIEAGFQH